MACVVAELLLQPRNALSTANLSLLRSHQLKPHLPPDECRGALQRFDRHIALCFEDAINLGSACVHQLRQLRLAHPLSFHFLAELPRDDSSDGFGFRRFPDAVFVEELVQCRAPMWILLRLAHFVISTGISVSRSSAMRRMIYDT